MFDPTSTNIMIKKTLLVSRFFQSLYKKKMCSTRKLLLLATLPTIYWIQSSHGFTMSFYGSSDIWPGSTAFIKWNGAARNVNVMLAVQNKDSTLSPVGQTTFNVDPSSPSFIRINKDTPTGRNYFFIAEDMIDPSNYTSVGPFAVVDPFGDAHPTNSIAATATERFLTDSQPTATSSIAEPNGSIRSKSIPTATNSVSHNDDDRSPFIGTFLTIAQIVGISIGCVAATIIIAISYVNTIKCKHS